MHNILQYFLTAENQDRSQEVSFGPCELATVLNISLSNQDKCSRNTLMHKLSMVCSNLSREQILPCRRYLSPLYKKWQVVFCIFICCFFFCNYTDCSFSSNFRGLWGSGWAKYVDCWAQLELVHSFIYCNSASY